MAILFSLYRITGWRPTSRASSPLSFGGAAPCAPVAGSLLVKGGGASPLPSKGSYEGVARSQRRSEVKNLAKKGDTLASRARVRHVLTPTHILQEGTALSGTALFFFFFFFFFFPDFFFPGIFFFFFFFFPLASPKGQFEANQSRGRSGSSVQSGTGRVKGPVWLGRTPGGGLV